MNEVYRAWFCAGRKACLGLRTQSEVLMLRLIFYIGYVADKLTRLVENPPFRLYVKSLDSPLIGNVKEML